MELLYGKDKEISEVAKRHFGVDFEPCTAIGMVRNNIFVGAVIYNNLHKNNVNKPISLEASVILLDKRGLNRYIIGALFHYPFADLKIRTLFVRVARKNKRHRKIAQRLGFRFVGIMRDSYPLGGDAALYDMQAHECKWLRNAVSTLSARSSTDSGGTDIL